MGSSSGADCAALPEGGVEGRPSADAAGDDAAACISCRTGMRPRDPMAEGSSVKQSIRWIDCSAERSMTARRYAALPGSNWAVTAFRTSRGPWPQWGRVSPEGRSSTCHHLLERHGLTEAIFAEVNAHPDASDLCGGERASGRQGHLAAASRGTRAPWSTRRSSTRRPRQRTRPARGTPRCRPPRRETTGISGVRRIRN